MSLAKALVLGAPADQGIPLVAALERRGFAVSAGVRRADALKATPVAHPPAIVARLEQGLAA